MKTISHHSKHIRRKSLDPAYAQEKASAPRLHWSHPRGCLPGHASLVFWERVGLHIDVQGLPGP